MSMYLVPAEDRAGAIKDCLVNVQMYAMNNQNRFPIKFCVNSKVYFFMFWPRVT